MIATMDFIHQTQKIFHYEFPLPSPDYIVGVSWAEGVKLGIEEFRKAKTGLSLFDISLEFGVQP